MMIQNGQRPIIPQSIQSSTDSHVQLILKAIQSCWIHDPEQRPTAIQIYHILTNATDIL